MQFILSKMRARVNSEHLSQLTDTRAAGDSNLDNPHDTQLHNATNTHH